MPEDLHESFRTTHLASTEAFNRGDLDQALGGLPMRILHAFDLWEFDGTEPVRVRQFLSRDEALAAVA